MSQAQNEFADALVAIGPHERIPTQQQIFGPFVGRWRLLKISANAFAGLSRTEKIIGVAQTLLGTPLLFLLGLALRNRFRMR